MEMLLSLQVFGHEPKWFGQIETFELMMVLDKKS